MNAKSTSRPLKVFRYSAPKRSYYVATRTKKDAREAFGITGHEFEQFVGRCDDKLGAGVPHEGFVYVEDPANSGIMRELQPGERIR